MARAGSTKTQTTSKRVVYTALIGDYEQLNEQPVAAASGVRFVCFTDSDDITSSTWEIRRVEPRFPLDAIRSARYLKIKGTELLSEFEESLWIDNSVLLRRDPAELLDAWLGESDLALPLHSYRMTLMGEFDTVAVQGYDDPARVYEQLITYSSTVPHVLEQVPHWTAILARKHTGTVRAVMDEWYDQVLRYSRRDQLSINYALDRTAVDVNSVELDNWQSEWHQWPMLTERKWAVTQDRLAGALRVPLADIGKLENMVMELKAQLDHLGHTTSRVDQVVHEFTSSTSWRITAPLRRVSGFFAARKRR